MKRKRFIKLAMLLLLPVLGTDAQNWTHVGPVSTNMIGGDLFETGRLDCIATDIGFNGTSNQVVYAGGTAGSLWKSTDLGLNWNPVVIPDAVKFHGISALCPLPSGIILVSTVNVGYKKNQNDNIYTFNPGSNTWAATGFSTVAGPSAYVNHLRYCPGNPLIVFATTTAGLFKSVDGGISWALVSGMTGIYENIEFIPAAWATGGYQLILCGEANIMVSTDMGNSFVMKTSLTSLLYNAPGGPLYYVDLAATYNYASVNTRYIYFDVLEFYPVTCPSGTCYSPYHHIVRLRTDANTFGLETIDDIGNTVGLVSDFAGSTDRSCLGAYDEVCYFGGGGLMKFNANTMSFFDTPTSGTDAVPLPGGYYIPYNSPAHSDNHDIIMLPAINKILYANDGGFYVNSYVPQTNPTIFQNNWQRSNNGLNISQIWGLSCAEEDGNEYITGEQDTKSFRVNATAPVKTFASQGTEPSLVLIDNFNKNNYLYSSHASHHNILGNYDGNFVSTYPEAPVPSATTMCNSQYSDCGGFNCFPGPEFSSNTLFQDRNRPNKIFFGAKNGGLFEFCPTTRKFVLKKGFNVGPTTWNQFVNGMAFSQANKNKVYALLSNRDFGGASALAQPEVFSFNSPDFDNSWAGFNDSWQNITPNFTLPPFTTPVVFPQTASIQFVGIAASDWNPDRIFVAIREVAGNPGLKVIKRENNTWTDYSAGIPSDEVPITLVYEQGTNDQLYLGTGTNIYYRNGAMLSWMPYSGTLPNLAMNQLRINYKENELRVGTYGHGMWKSDLKCPSQFNVIESGAVLTDKFVEAENNITAQTVNMTINNVIYRSGGSIDLLPFFEAIAPAGKMFYAFIHGCSGPGNSFRSAENEESITWSPEKIKDAFEKQQKSGIAIFPNPSEGLFYLEKDSDIAADIQVYDLMGKTILSLRQLTDSRITIDMQDQPQGIYLLKVKIGEELITERLIRQ